MDKPEVLHMGLQPIDLGQWIEPDSSLPTYYQHKIDCRQNDFSRVYQALPESILAQQELGDLMLAHLLDDHGHVYRQKGDELIADAWGMRWPIDVPDLWHTSLWVQDDICLLQESAEGYRLTAASLCCPSQWSLQQKMGLPLIDIHRPVPALEQQIGESIKRFFDYLKPQRPVQRFNWSIQPHQQLAWWPSEREMADENTRLHYRVERQTLRRLPKTGAVVFTIRVYIHALETLQNYGSALPDLLAAVDACDTNLAAYKSFPAIAPALERYRV